MPLHPTQLDHLVFAGPNLEHAVAQKLAQEDWRALARRGGYPVPALELPSEAARATWFAGSAQTYLERDLPQPTVHRWLKSASAAA